MTDTVADELDHDPAEPLGDLTPRVATPQRRRRLLPVLLLLLVVGALAFVLIKGLGDAALFFRNVDDAVENRDELGDRRFRMQGTPVDGTIVESTIDGETAIIFTVRFDGALADVVHRGDPPGLFQPEVPVILEGRWTPAADAPDFVGGADDGWYFASDRMVVKHEEDYREDRLDEADEKGQIGRDDLVSDPSSP